ncbi:alpha-1,6-mannosyltransferase Och1 [Drechmeria coniospora]|uniref:Alpha-1,6-mannosyltransferase Och1 n=1 Tax=Drechmeria coniospora TaxID=98403 RepID=A0A151GUX0_DRECN|nr:alpha-1,6-mannosyltransferase Och1 [Drechmeria coniospora]KYK60916.1 alpha-1,6-mannosyltransferase Och1 [Drechmeria coniospora]ODA83604.1 hypothetical protein RJ55_02119 [Drechmeria coniospora]
MLKYCRLASTIAIWALLAVALLSLASGRRQSYRSWSVASSGLGATSSIPHKIWQIFLTPPKADRASFQIESSSLAYTASWLARHPNYEYVLVGDEGVEPILDQNYKDDEFLHRIFREMKSTGMRSDLLRYVLLATRGGIYADLDVEAVRPFDEWVPAEYKDRARVVVGVEFDRLDGPNWNEVHEDMQFAQWTIAAAPGHPLLRSMVRRVVSTLEAYVEEKGITLAELKAESADVMVLTGAAAWTDNVLAQLQRYEPAITSLRDLSGLKEPRLVGDILILPINGFGMGQSHSGSSNDGTIPHDAMTRHNFHGSWRNDGSN